MSHCTFCGLNGSSMAFRSKSPERVRREITELEERHGFSRFEAVDNSIFIQPFRGRQRQKKAEAFGSGLLGSHAANRQRFAARRNEAYS